MPGRSAGSETGSSARREERRSREVAEVAMFFPYLLKWLPGYGFDKAEADDEGEGKRESYCPDIEGDGGAACGHSVFPGRKERTAGCIAAEVLEGWLGELATTTERWHEVQGRGLAQDRHDRA